MKLLLGFLVGVYLSVSSVSAQLDEWAEMLGLEQIVSPADDDTVAGLREALFVGSANAVLETGRLDGYFGNEVIRILLPERLEVVVKGLRVLGQGEVVDDFVLSMNRAAERAAPYAKEIFWDAIREIRFDDARQILTGGDTAATDYFRATTSDRLSAAFRPVVERATDKVGVTRQYKEMVGRYRSIPFTQAVAFDVDEYVVEKALDGLFHVLAEEERKIRTDPAARVTEILQRVFG
jgi:hypothetical protein